VSKTRTGRDIITERAIDSAGMIDGGPDGRTRAASEVTGEIWAIYCTERTPPATLCVLNTARGDPIGMGYE